MHNQSAPQTVSVCRDDLSAISEHLSLESFHKLNRACETLHYFGSDLRRHEINGLSQLYLYHAYLVYMEAHGYKNTLSLTMFGKGLSSMLKEYGLNYGKRRTNQGMQTNLALRDESNADWLPRCDETTAT